MAADVLGAAFGRRGFGDMLTLDVLPDLVPVLESVLSLAHERHVQVGQGLCVPGKKQGDLGRQDGPWVRCSWRMFLEEPYVQAILFCSAHLCADHSFTSYASQVALDISALITRAFAPTIREVCGQGAAINARCVDMAFEQRKSKCEMARMVLQGLQTKLAFVARTREGSPLGARAGDLAAQLAGL